MSDGRICDNCGVSWRWSDLMPRLESKPDRYRVETKMGDRVDFCSASCLAIWAGAHMSDREVTG